MKNVGDAPSPSSKEKKDEKNGTNPMLGMWVSSMRATTRQRDFVENDPSCPSSNVTEATSLLVATRLLGICAVEHGAEFFVGFDMSLFATVGALSVGGSAATACPLLYRWRGRVGISVERRCCRYLATLLLGLLALKTSFPVAYQSRFFRIDLAQQRRIVLGVSGEHDIASEQTAPCGLLAKLVPMSGWAQSWAAAWQNPKIKRTRPPPPMLSSWRQCTAS